jgi:hypothetical protein
MRFVVFALLLLVFSSPSAFAKPAWQLPVLQAVESESLLASLDTCKWDTADSATKFKWEADPDNPGQKRCNFDVLIDHNNAGPYPVGWPSFQATFPSVQDWSAWDGIQYQISAKCDKTEIPLPIRMIVRDADIFHLIPMKSGETKTISVRLAGEDKTRLKSTKFVHFYLDEGEYPDKAHVTFVIKDLKLVKLKEIDSQLPAKEAGVELYTGKDSEAVILPAGTKSMSGKTIIHTGAECSIKSGDKLVYTATELFSGRKLKQTGSVDRPISGNQVVEIPFTLALGKVPAGYYWVTCDVVRNGKSLLNGRVGFEDFYIKKPAESMTYTMLSLRTAMGLYIIDPLGGYGRGSVSFMHTYDPRDAKHYVDFIKAYRGTTSKHTEGLEAGVAGTVFAAYGFRQSGDIARAKFTEKLLKSNCDYMIKYMQHTDGTVSTQVNAYYDKHVGQYTDEGTMAWSLDTNQIGEWLRAIARTIIYLKDVPEQKAYMMKLYQAGEKTADYLVAVTTDPIGDHKHVIRHFSITGTKENPKRALFYQEGRQCDVYVPRAMAGLSYFAYARQLIKGDVPQTYLDALRDTTHWAMDKMKPDTYWFDWQCGYEVEGGCHSFLGNQYLAEGTQGYYLLCAARKDAEDAKLAAECTRRALRFLTDTERSMKNNQPCLEFWVGPYLYWQYSEYLGSIGYEKPFADYLAVLHKNWAVERNWKDFTKRGGGDMVGRADDLSHLTMALPAYPGLRYMEEIGKPFKYAVPMLNELGK